MLYHQGLEQEQHRIGAQYIFAKMKEDQRFMHHSVKVLISCGNSFTIALPMTLVTKYMYSFISK